MTRARRELPGDEPRTIVTALQDQTPVDLSGIEVDQHQLTVDGRTIALQIVRPTGATGTLPVFMFYHGAVWIAGNFANHKRLVRDLVVGSQAVAVFPEYTPVPDARYPVQIDQAYAAAAWVSHNGVELGVDSSRLAVTGNSVGGNMAAAVTLMVHDKGGANIVYQQLLWPALSAELDTESYRAYGEGRFLPRAFMQYGWDHYAPDPETRKHRYAAPLQATTDQLRGLPPTLIQTAENDVLRDEGEAYARKLDEAGVSVTNTRYKQQRPSPPQLVTRSRTMTTPVTSSMDAAEPLARRFNVPSPADGAAATVARPAIQARPRRPGGG